MSGYVIIGKISSLAVGSGKFKFKIELEFDLKNKIEFEVSPGKNKICGVSFKKRAPRRDKYDIIDDLKANPFKIDSDFIELVKFAMTNNRRVELTYEKPSTVNEPRTVNKIKVL